MKPRKKVILAIVALFLVIAAVIVVRFLPSYLEYQNAVAHMTLSHTDASNIPDGVYVGECDVSLIYAKVEVHVENNAITDIRILEHRNGRGASAEKIAGEMVAQQRLDVDAVAGATNSSIVIKKAVDNALSGAR